MTTRKVLTSLAAVAALGFAAGYAGRAAAQKPAAAPATAPAGAGGAAGAAAPACAKTFGDKGKCCDPAVMAHLPKEAVFKACGESEATFLGEAAQKDTCKYVFKVEGSAAGETFVQVYAPMQKEIPSSPTEPFFSWKKVGKVFVTDKAKTPKAAPILVSSTGMWFPGKGYFVSVNASTKVCTKAEASKLAAAIK